MGRKQYRFWRGSEGAMPGPLVASFDSTKQEVGMCCSWFGQVALLCCFLLGVLFGCVMLAGLLYILLSFDNESDMECITEYRYPVGKYCLQLLGSDCCVPIGRLIIRFTNNRRGQFHCSLNGCTYTHTNHKYDGVSLYIYIYIWYSVASPPSPSPPQWSWVRQVPPPPLWLWSCGWVVVV